MRARGRAAMGGGLNGEFDNYLPVEMAQKPLYRMLGTPAADKKMIAYPSGYLVPREGDARLAR